MLARTAALLLVCGGLMTDTALSQTRPTRQPASIDARFERTLLKQTHGHGTLVDVHTGAADTPTTIFIHGMPGAVSSLAGVIQKAIDAGGTVKAFAYDNKYRSLEDSSRDLASSLESWMDDNPDRALRIAAHSMGGRLALGALAILNRDGRLTGDVELNLMASPIAGIKGAIFSVLAPGFIPWIRPMRGI